MTTLIVFLGVAFAILLAGFYSAVETAAYGASVTRLRYLKAQGRPAAEVALRLLGRLAKLVTAALIGHNLSVYAATFLLTRELDRLRAPDAELLATVVLTPLCFIFAEVLPKRMAHARPNRSLLATAEVVRVSRMVFLPLGFVLNLIAEALRLLMVRLGYHTQPVEGRRRLLEYLEVSAAEGVLSDSQHRMAQRIMAIQELTVRDVMIPMKNAFLLREDLTCLEAARLMQEVESNRAPLADRSGRPTMQVVTLNAVLREGVDPQATIAGCGIPALSVAAHISVAKAMRKLQAEQARLAIVVGKGGGPVGVVTVSDCISTIFGALQL